MVVTGDESNISLWVILCLFAGIAAYVTGRRMREETNVVRTQSTGHVMRFVVIVAAIILLFAGAVTMQV